MTEILTEEDLAQHVAYELELPMSDDLGSFDITKTYITDMAERFFDTFCDNDDRGKEYHDQWKFPESKE
jgi:hypothetical protein